MPTFFSCVCSCSSSGWLVLRAIVVAGWQLSKVGSTPCQRSSTCGSRLAAARASSGSSRRGGPCCLAELPTCFVVCCIVYNFNISACETWKLFGPKTMIFDAGGHKKQSKNMKKNLSNLTKSNALTRPRGRRAPGGCFWSTFIGFWWFWIVFCAPCVKIDCFGQIWLIWLRFHQLGQKIKTSKNDCLIAVFGKSS